MTRVERRLSDAALYLDQCHWVFGIVGTIRVRREGYELSVSLPQPRLYEQCSVPFGKVDTLCDVLSKMVDELLARGDAA